MECKESKIFEMEEDDQRFRVENLGKSYVNGAFNEDLLALWMIIVAREM